MSFGHIELPSYKAEAIVRDFRVRGKFQPVGPLLTFLNDESRRYALFKEAEIASFAMANPLGRLQRSELMVSKADMVGISILDQDGMDAAQLLASRHKMIVYTSYFVIQGFFHMGVDDLPLDVMSSSRFDFIGATDVSLYPLSTLQHGPNTKVPMMLINRNSVSLYHLLEGD